jgi:flagellar hook-basal body complex protein FliE
MTIESVHAQQLLAQMRALAAQARGVEATPAPAATDPASFTALMRQAIEHVNANQQQAQRLSTAFEKGEPGVDLGEVMVSLQKANLAFQAATQVRNRLVSAYQDIMNMPL